MRIERSNWEQRTLGEFFDLQMGKTPSRKDLSLWEDGDTPWVSISDMKESRYISDTKEHLPYQTIAECRIPIIPVGTVIMSFKLTIGKTCIVSKPLTTNEAIMAFYPKKGIEVNSSFLAYALSALKWKGNRAVKGVTINKKTISEKNFSLPPIGLQDNIAAELDAIQEVIDGYKDQIADLDALAQSIFLTTFGDPVANSKGWEVKQLQDIVTDDCKLTYGIVQPGEEVPNGVPVVRSIDMSSPVIYLKNLKRVDPPIAQKYQRTKLEGDEIFISCRGVTGVISLASEELKGGNITRGLVSARLKLGERLFVYYCLRMPQINSIIQDKTKGATLRQINVKDIRLLPIIFPPIDMQKAFAAQMDSINLQNNLLRQQLADAEMLMAERMQYYFS